MARAPAVQDVEELPEPDRLEGAPRPRETAALFGQTAAEQALADAFAGGRMHHGWLLTGREGIGKATLAYRFAKYALAVRSQRDPSGMSLAVPPDCSAARQVIALSHPGLLVLRRPWNFQSKRLMTVISVDEVRKLRSFLVHSADGHRVVIVDSADELNVNAANALLKSLEEPPPATTFLLITSEPGRLLPTIRSRCRTLALEPLGPDALRSAAQQAFKTMEGDPPEPSDWTRLIALSDGSIRRLLSLWTGGGFKLQDRIEAIFGALPRLDWTAVHALSDELASNAAAERFDTFFELLLQLLTRMIRARALGATDTAEAALGARLIPEARLASWAELWETIVREKAAGLALNLDRKSLIMDAFSRIEATAGAART